MTLGETLIDRDGTPHKMAGLLGLTTSFETPNWCGHEFHYASTINAEGPPLFHAQDAEDRDLGPIGLIEGRVRGSFAHVIDVGNFDPLP